MSKMRKGYEAQDRVIAQFKSDVRRAFGGSATDLAIKQGKKNAEYRAKKKAEAEAKPRFSPKFIHTGR